MEWQRSLEKICKKHSLEAFQTPSGITVISPKKLSDETETEINAAIPEDVKREIRVGYSVFTAATLEGLVKFGGFSSADLTDDKGKLTLDLQGDAAIFQQEGVMEKFETVLRNDPYIQSYTIRLNDNTIAYYNPKLLSKRPERSCPISTSDVLNLKIDLGMCTTIDDFIARM